jgi:hypothetical protein
MQECPKSKLSRNRCTAAAGPFLFNIRQSSSQHSRVHTLFRYLTLGTSLEKHFSFLSDFWLVCVCRDLDSLDDLHFGVHESMMYASNTPPVPGAQWTGIVTQIAIEMLESGQVEAVVCVQNDESDRFTPKPVRLFSAALVTCIGCLQSWYADRYISGLRG